MNTALFKQEMANIEEYAQTLCETLEENFKQDSIDSYRAMQMREGYSIYCLLYTSPSPRDPIGSRMPSSA